eukprot:SAG22_NODE_2154_length_2921_cov_1.131467_3_plen_258_part_00
MIYAVPSLAFWKAPPPLTTFYGAPPQDKQTDPLRLPRQAAVPCAGFSSLSVPGGPTALAEVDLPVFAAFLPSCLLEMRSAGRKNHNPTELDPDKNPVWKLRDCLNPDPNTAKSVFVEMTEYKASSLQLTGIQFGHHTENEVWAEVEHSIHNAPLEVESVTIDEIKDGVTTSYTAEIRMKCTRDLDETARQNAWDELVREVSRGFKSQPTVKVDKISKLVRQPTSHPTGHRDFFIALPLTRVNHPPTVSWGRFPSSKT